MTIQPIFMSDGRFFASSMVLFFLLFFFRRFCVLPKIIERLWKIIIAAGSHERAWQKSYSSYLDRYIFPRQQQSFLLRFFSVSARCDLRRWQRTTVCECLPTHAVGEENNERGMEMNGHIMMMWDISVHKCIYIYITDRSF